MICRDIYRLDPEFRSRVIHLISKIERDGLPFRVFETYRSKLRQAALYAMGRSKTMKSKHLTGKACDFVIYRNGKWDWSDIKTYRKLGELVKEDDRLAWGGNWKSFKDYCHVELKEG